MYWPDFWSCDENDSQPMQLVAAKRNLNMQQWNMQAVTGTVYKFNALQMSFYKKKTRIKANHFFTTSFNSMNFVNILVSKDALFAK